MFAYINIEDLKTKKKKYITFYHILYRSSIDIDTDSQNYSSHKIQYPH